jgi:hypothetical protein
MVPAVHLEAMAAMAETVALVDWAFLGALEGRVALKQAMAETAETAAMAAMAATVETVDMEETVALELVRHMAVLVV